MKQNARDDSANLCPNMNTVQHIDSSVDAIRSGDSEKITPATNTGQITMNSQSA